MKAPRLLLLLTALLFSTGGAAIKACDMTSWQVAGFRSGIAALVLLVLPGARRGYTPATFVVGLAYAATVVLYVQANKLTTAANAIFLQSTAPLYIALLAPLLLRERLRARELGFMAILAAGLALFFVQAETAWHTAPDPPAGNLLGAAAGVAWALTILGLRWQGARDALPAVVTGNLLAFVVCLPWALPVEAAAPSDLAALAYLGAVQIGLAYVLFSRGIRHVPALEASLLLLVEPAFSPLWAWALHGERPGSWALAGGLMILGATAAKTWLDARRPVAA